MNAIKLQNIMPCSENNNDSENIRFGLSEHDLNDKFISIRAIAGTKFARCEEREHAASLMRLFVGIR